MKTEILQIRIEEKLLKDLKILAESNGLSLSSQVRMLVKKGVEKGKAEFMGSQILPYRNGE